jgi:hypothetical protein
LLCGHGKCVEFAPETSMQWVYAPAGIQVRPVVPAPYFAVRFAQMSGSLAYWMPSAGVLRTAPQSGDAVWVRPAPDELEALRSAAAQLRPFPAPHRASVTVGFRDVRRGASTYLQLFAMGVSVQRATGARGWIWMDVWTGDTPWTYGMSISRNGGFLRYPTGETVKIPWRVADHVRRRLPITG